MSRFDREWALVPQGARWTAVLVGLAVMALVSWIWFVPIVVDHDFGGSVVLAPLLVMGAIGGAMAAGFVCLVGYVFGDARRRGMNHVLWTLLAVFIPNAIGIILYFILRDPAPVPCPACGTPAPKGHAFCAACGAAVRVACGQCRQPVEPGWRACPRCGVALAGTAQGVTSQGVRS